MEDRIRIIEKAIEYNLDAKTTESFINLLNNKYNPRILETRIGVFADETGNYKTVCQRCNELGIETIGDLIRLGGKAFRESGTVGVKTAALISDTLAAKYGIYDWFSKEKEE